MPQLQEFSRIERGTHFTVKGIIYPESWKLVHCVVNLSKLVYTELVSYNGTKVTALYMENDSVLFVAEVFDLATGVWRKNTLPTHVRVVIEEGLNTGNPRPKSRTRGEI